ncbi:membrane protein insertase YidC [Dietzia sp.]|uniref:membrane protein insertase YidC n=1 Tax=Dietzia sp. TaxID=1871616 RepID=UPI002FDB5A13
MLDALAYPVSLVMKFWHWLLSLVVPGDSGIAWVGSILLLVVTVRLILLRPMWVQMFSMRKMATLTPELKRVQKEFKDDKAKQAEEMQRIYSEAQVNPLSGCLPMLVQIPVFLGLYHTLIGFTPQGMSIAEAAQQSNGAFGPDQVSQFHAAQFLGVPLAAYIRIPQEQLASLTGGDASKTGLLVMCVILFALAGIATWINMRNSMNRQKRAREIAAEEERLIEETERAGGPVVDGEVVAIDGDESKAQSAAKKAAEDAEAKAKKKAEEPEVPDFAQALSESMNSSMKIMMYIFPIFPLVGAFLFNFPIAIGIYFLLNNCWTAVQSHMFLNRLEKLLPTGGQAGLPPSAFM